MDIQWYFHNNENEIPQAKTLLRNFYTGLQASIGCQFYVMKWENE